jgi:hypothetical protein
MQDLHLLVVFRGAERLLIEVGGLTTIVLGTLLYRWGIRSPQQLEASGSGFSFALKNAAPGSVLALFGMTVLVVGLLRPVEIKSSQEAETSISAARSAIAAPQYREQQALSVNYSGAVDRALKELDRLATLPELSGDPARETLQDSRCAARGVLAVSELPSQLSEFFQHVHEAPQAGDAAATLARLSAEARRVKQAVASAR